MVKPRMTLEEFLQRLAETPRDWKLASSLDPLLERVFIRRYDGRYSMCPITALTGQPASYAGTVAEQLGLSRDDTDAIMNAADGLGEPALRAQLERACGLETSPECARRDDERHE